MRGSRREPTPTSRPLSSTCVSWHARRLSQKFGGRERVKQADEVIEGTCLWKAGVGQGRDWSLYAQPCGALGLPEQHLHFEKEA